MRSMPNKNLMPFTHQSVQPSHVSFPFILSELLGSLQLAEETAAKAVKVMMRAEEGKCHPAKWRGETRPIQGARKQISVIQMPTVLTFRVGIHSSNFKMDGISP